MRAALFILLLTACSDGEPAPPGPQPVTGVELRREKAAELTCFPELPPGAEPALLAIQTAAEAGDLKALRSWLAEGFKGSFEDPEILRELAATLDRGCLEDDSGKRVVCPPEYRHDPNHPGWRAGIERQPQGWRLIFFVKGS